MKHLLLLSALGLLTCASAFATTDNQTYEPVNGIKAVNVWTIDRVHNPETYASMPFVNTYARTATLYNDVVYVSRSDAQSVIIGTDTIPQSVIYRLDAKTGNLLSSLPLTLDGKPYGGLLSANSIGFDNFGHMWVMPYCSGAATATEAHLYSCDPNTGALTLVATLPLGDVVSRIDYFDVIGDITRVNAPCNIKAPGSQVTTIYSWTCAKGSNTWEGGFEGDTYMDITEFFPATAAQWGYAPMIKQILGEDEDTKYNGELFYIDGFNSTPAIYDMTGSKIDDFEKVDASLWPENGTNGVNEFTLDGRNFMVYSKAQYSGDGHGCQVNVVELGEGMSLSGMKKYWQLPADSLGKTSDGGTRIHSIAVQYGTEGGEPCVTLLTYKNYNGLAIYKIGKGVSGGTTTKGDINGDGTINVTDVTALVNKILGSGSYSDSVCDINGDGTVNVTDVTTLVNMILGNK
ncbi:MAG: dockerin type I repeat-containing protein [Muribaculaceae bacterium]|nr:dockerin type I repeat-containing protein [Muribaculaceae bacterium]